MTELIKVNYDNDRPTVLGRDLHEFLGVDTPYTIWFERMCGYGFSESVDYVTNLLDRSDGKAGKPKTDHQLTIEMAKEIAMLQRNEQGKKARQYFIQLEKDWNSPEKVMARALRIADQKIYALETQNLVLEQKVAEYEPIVQYVDTILQCPDAVTTSQIAADYGLSARRLNAILHEERIQRNVGGQWILYTKHMNKGYTKSETVHFKHSDGRDDVKMQTKWTQKGRLKIHNILESRGIMANMDKDIVS